MYIRTEVRNGKKYELTQISETTIGSSWESVQARFAQAAEEKNCERFTDGLRVIVSENGQYIELVGVRIVPNAPAG